MADAALLKAFRRLQRAPITSQDLEAIAKEVRGASDRATALIYAVALDAAIENCLKRRMVALSIEETDQLFRGVAPLSSFSAKINVAYALHAFGKKTKRDLHFIREIRNGFAHEPRVLRFSVKEVSDLCSSLYYPDNILVALPNPNQDIKEPISFPHAGSLSNPRSRYEIACQTIVFNLIIFDISDFNYEHRLRYLP